MNWFQFFVAALELPPDPKARQLWARLAHLQLIYSLAGLLVGLACIVGGLGLFLHGVYGSSSIEFGGRDETHPSRREHERKRRAS